MSLKYFYYVSKAKVFMLEAQIKRKITISGLSPKLDISGVSLGVDAQFPTNDDLISRTLSLSNAIGKMKLAKRLVDCSELGTSVFYEDKSKWLSGLVKFGTIEDQDYERQDVVVYLLWKLWKDSIIVLVGSPGNILGFNTKDEYPGTPFEIDTLLKFIDSNLDRNEPYVIPDEVTDWGSVVGIDDGEFDVIDGAPIEQYSFPSAIRIGVFCAKYLRKLPQTHIDTLFRIFQVQEFDRQMDLPRWISELKSLALSGDERTALERCRVVYVGSPIYTALM